MAQLNDRNRVLRHLAVSEGLIKQFKSLGHEEATWRNDHEHKMMIAWARERHAFIQGEIDSLLPARQRPKPKPGAVPIVSHRVGRPGASGQIFGESYG